MICENVRAPLWIVLVKIFALWMLVNVGCYTLLPLFGFDTSYNSEPIAIALYFLGWVVLCIFCFGDVFRAWKNEGKPIGMFRFWKPKKPQIWMIVAQSLAGAMLIWMLIYGFSFSPALKGPILAPYTDILFSTPWYFLPKSVEILIQQILLTALVLTFHLRFRSFRKVLVGYLTYFVGAHLLYLFAGMPTMYWAIITMGALLSTVVFPYLILRVRGGFVLTYILHLVFYLGLAMFLHTWPPPGYFLQ